MSNIFDRLGSIFFVKETISRAVVRFKGCGSCGCPISMAAILTGITIFPLWCTVPTSASAADDIIFLMLHTQLKWGRWVCVWESVLYFVICC